MKSLLLDENEILLLQRIADGDRLALKTFYDRTSPRLLGLLLRVTGDRQMAEDALVELFTGLWQGRTVREDELLNLALRIAVACMNRQRPPGFDNDRTRRKEVVHDP